MAEINNNYAQPQVQTQQMQQKPQMQMSPYMQPAQLGNPNWTIRDEFLKQHKRNGLFERLYNGIKNLTGLGIGSKKVEQEVSKAENGEISEEQARETIDKYRKSQVNGQQGFGDFISIGAAGLSFFGVINNAKKLQATIKLNNKFGKKSFLANIAGKSFKEMQKYAVEYSLAHLNSKTKLTLVATFGATLIGGFSKSISLLINRIGSQSADKKEFNGAITPYDKLAYKQAKKDAKKERGRNFISGMINGAMLPLSMIGGAFVGVPLYLIGNSLNRYFVANRKEENKSFRSYVENLKSDSVMHAAFTVATALPMAGKARYSAVLDKNLKTAMDSIMRHSYLKENLYGGNTAYQEIESLVFAEPTLKNIMEGIIPCKRFYDPIESWRQPIETEIKEVKNIPQELKEHVTETLGEGSKIIKQAKDNKYLIKQADGKEKWFDIKSYNSTRYLTPEEQVEELIKHNIFAAKLKQIQGAEEESFLFMTRKGNADPLTRALQEGCFPTRTLEEASSDIKNALGDGYQVLKHLGTGTVAESYLAKDSSGKEVCIKIIKKGIDVEKITKDKEKTIELIKNIQGKTDAEKKYLIKNIEDLADGIIKEVDLTKEMNGADEIRKFSKTCNVVKGIECKNNVYVMEKAKGVSLKQLLEQTQNKDNVVHELKNLEKKLAKATPEERKIIQYKIDRIKNEQKEILDTISDLSEDDLNYILKNYMDVLVEQLYKIDKSGRTLHADIHPGNIFIDLQALKDRKGKLFTLIDTGNTIKLSALQAEQSMKLTNYIKYGDTEDMSKYFIEDADLSASSLSKEEAAKKVQEELDKIFFDSETRLGPITNTDVINMVSNIMKDMNIMPGQTSLNLEKAKVSAEKSFDILIKMFENNSEKLIDEKGNFVSKLGTGVKQYNKQSEIISNYKKLQSEQEKRNLWQLLKSPKEFFKSRKNPNYKKDNSVEHLTYHLKQQILKPEAESSMLGF